MITDFLDENGNWKCIQCGACCKNVKALLPDFALPDGRCSKLGEDNRCSIYDNRPEVCKMSFFGDVKRMNQVYLARLCNDVRGKYEATN